MNPDALIDEFDRLNEAPGAIPLIRRFVLDLAVRGRLIDQSADDIPADQLIASIDSSTENRRTLRPSYRQLIIEPIPWSDALFPVPPTWAWVRLGRISDLIQRGKSPSYSDDGGPLVVSQKCVRWEGLQLVHARHITEESLFGYEPDRFLRDDDLLWNSTGTGTIGRVARLVSTPERLVCDSHVTVVRCPRVVPEYIRCWLRSDHVFGRIEEVASGSTNQVELTLQQALGQILPLPPLDEQQRIVVKVDELMSLCGELEAAQAERERRKDRLAAALLEGLTSGEVPRRRKLTQFYLSHNERLITRPAQVEDVRNAVRKLAVRGELLERDERAWTETTLGSVGRWGSGGTPSRSRPDYFGGDIPWIVIGDLNNSVVTTTAETITELGLSSSSAKLIDPGTLLIAMYGASVGKLGTAGMRCATNQAIAHCIPDPEVVQADYLFLVLRGLRSALVARGRGGAQPNISQAILKSWPVLIPPLGEQPRIVAKVTELMRVCVGLEEKLTAVQTGRSRLLEAVLHEALADAGADPERALAEADHY